MKVHHQYSMFTKTHHFCHNVQQTKFQYKAYVSLHGFSDHCYVCRTKHIHDEIALEKLYGLREYSKDQYYAIGRTNRL